MSIRMCSRRFVYRQKAFTMWTPSTRHGRTFSGEHHLKPHLLEACHARSAARLRRGILRGISSRYNVDMERRYRWIRGDWQITHGFLPRVPGSTPGALPIRFPCCRNGKFLEQPAAQSRSAGLASVCCWELVLMPDSAVSACCWSWDHRTPRLLAALVNALRKPHDLPWTCICAKWPVRARGSSVRFFSPWLFWLTTRSFSVDAIGKTLVRLLVTRKRLLECKHRATPNASRAPTSPTFMRPCGLRPASRWPRTVPRPPSSGATHFFAAAAGGLAGGTVDCLVDQPADYIRGAGLIAGRNWFFCAAPRV